VTPAIAILGLALAAAIAALFNEEEEEEL